MNGLYELMDRYLDIDKDMKSVIYIVKKMESTYSEEDNSSEKYICNTMLMLLTQVENKMQNALKIHDEYIVKKVT